MKMSMITTTMMLMLTTRKTLRTMIVAITRRRQGPRTITITMAMMNDCGGDDDDDDDGCRGYCDGEVEEEGDHDVAEDEGQDGYMTTTVTVMMASIANASRSLRVSCTCSADLVLNVGRCQRLWGESQFILWVCSLG